MTALTRKQKTLIALGSLIGVVAIIATTALVTAALLTSSAAVSNVFTVGEVGITMTESKVDADGKKLTGADAAQVDTNTYCLVPNKTYDKDPVITVKDGSQESFLFVLVRNDIAAIEDTSDSTNKPTIAQQLAANGWAKYTLASTGWVYVWVGVGNVPDGDVEKASGEFTATAVTVTPDTYKLFETFSIAENADTTKYGAAKVTLTAVAIQDSGFENNVDAAWEAVKEAYPYIHTGSGS